MNARDLIPRRHRVERAAFEAEIVPAGQPVVLDGLVEDWQIVRAARDSRVSLASLLRRYDGGLRPMVIEAPAEMSGRVFFRDDMTGFAFDRRPAGIAETVDRLLTLWDEPRPPGLFLESLPADAYLPGFAAAHRLPLLDDRVKPRVWIGNAVKINTHFDLVNNVACVAAGKRKFTLFPPDQVRNLYLAPLDFTPSGAPVSMVQHTNPDFARFPRYADALLHARTAELGPGDALFIPYGWWHHVESLEPLNVLVNYWWNDVTAHGAPHGALLHAALTIRDLPIAQRAVWEALFGELVFTDPEQALAHLDVARRGMLGPSSPERNRTIREKLARDLGRAEPLP